MVALVSGRIGWETHQRLRFLQHVSLRVAHFFDDVRPHKVAAIDRCRSGREQLQRRNRYRLSKANARDVHAFHGGAGNQNAARLARDVHARGRAQPERIQIIVKGIHAQPQAQLHKHGIAGIAQRLRHGFRPVRVAPAADGAAIDLDRTRTIEILVHIREPGVQRGGAGENFEGGTRLISVRD